MASARERRAALLSRIIPPDPAATSTRAEWDAERKRWRAVAEDSAGVLILDESQTLSGQSGLQSEESHPASPANGVYSTEEPMKILFQSVTLDKEIPRFGDKGFASSSSTFFKAIDGCTIEFDTATSLVRLSKGSLVKHIPIYKVAEFGDVLISAVKDVA